jgi:hypothetical protein
MFHIFEALHSAEFVVFVFGWNFTTWQEKKGRGKKVQFEDFLQKIGLKSPHYEGKNNFFFPDLKNGFQQIAKLWEES